MRSWPVLLLAAQLAIATRIQHASIQGKVPPRVAAKKDDPQYAEKLLHNTVGYKIAGYPRNQIGQMQYTIYDWANSALEAEDKKLHRAYSPELAAQVKRKKHRIAQMASAQIYAIDGGHQGLAAGAYTATPMAVLMSIMDSEENEHKFRESMGVFSRVASQANTIKDVNWRNGWRAVQDRKGHWHHPGQFELEQPLASSSSHYLRHDFNPFLTPGREPPTPAQTAEALQAHFSPFVGRGQDMPVMSGNPISSTSRYPKVERHGSQPQSESQSESVPTYVPKARSEDKYPPIKADSLTAPMQLLSFLDFRPQETARLNSLSTSESKPLLGPSSSHSMGPLGFFPQSDNARPPKPKNDGNPPDFFNL